MKTIPIFIVINIDDSVGTTVSVHATHAKAMKDVMALAEDDKEAYGEDSLEWGDNNESYSVSHILSTTYIEVHQLEIPDGLIPEKMGVSSRGAGIIDMIKTGRF